MVVSLGIGILVGSVSCAPLAYSAIAACNEGECEPSAVKEWDGCTFCNVTAVHHDQNPLFNLSHQLCLPVRAPRRRAFSRRPGERRNSSELDERRECNARSKRLLLSPVSPSSCSTATRPGVPLSLIRRTTWIVSLALGIAINRGGVSRRLHVCLGTYSESPRRGPRRSWYRPLL